MSRPAEHGSDGRCKKCNSVLVNIGKFCTCLPCAWKGNGQGLLPALSKSFLRMVASGLPTAKPTYSQTSEGKTIYRLSDRAGEWVFHVSCSGGRPVMAYGQFGKRPSEWVKRKMRLLTDSES